MNRIIVMLAVALSAGSAFGQVGKTHAKEEKAAQEAKEKKVVGAVIQVTSKAGMVPISGGVGAIKAPAGMETTPPFPYGKDRASMDQINCEIEGTCKGPLQAAMDRMLARKVLEMTRKSMVFGICMVDKSKGIDTCHPKKKESGTPPKP